MISEAFEVLHHNGKNARFVRRSWHIVAVHDFVARQRVCNLKHVHTCRGGHLSPATSTGLVASVLLPMPSSPSLLKPQHLTPPPLTIAHVRPRPVAMATAKTPVG
jgi:hypothetical protein